MTIREFKESGKSLLIMSQGKIVYESDLNALEPLLDFLRSNQNLIKSDNSDKEFLIFDKFVGRAAAFLMTFLSPKKVYAVTISQFGREVFDKYKIEYKFEDEVKYLMGVASDKMCKWEKLTVDMTPEDFWQYLNK